MDWLEKLIAHETAYFAIWSTVEKTPFAWFLDGPEVREYHSANRALRLRDDERGAEAVARDVIAHFRQRRQTVAADVDEIAEAQGIGAMLRRMGVRPVIADTLLMRYPHAAPPVVEAQGVTLHRIRQDSANETRLWVETAISDDAGTEQEDLWRRVAEREVTAPDCHPLLALLGGEPAGTCDVFVRDGWAQIDSVATRPQFRRRGVASALVTQAVADALALGSEVIYLFTEAGGAGEQMYRRLGFASWRLNPLRRHLG